MSFLVFVRDLAKDALHTFEINAATLEDALRVGKERAKEKGMANFTITSVHDVSAKKAA